MRSNESRTLSEGRRLEILKRDWELCQYCGDPATHVDHIVPWCYEHNNSTDNLVAACALCNYIASDKLYDTFSAKRDAVLTRRLKMLEKQVVPIWLVSEVNTLGRTLRSYVRASCIVVETEKHRQLVAGDLRYAGLQANADPLK